MTRESPAARWNEYPLNLDIAQGYDDSYDFRAFHDQLRSDAGRIFNPECQLSIRLIELGIQETDFKDLGKLEDYLKGSNSRNATRVFLIPQRSSWGPLVMSDEAAYKLFSYLEVHPVFIDVVRAFGSRTRADNESYATFHEQRNREGTREICYLIKHAELNGREGASNPWSIRQMGVWHLSRADGPDTFIIINPCGAILRFFGTLQKSGIQQNAAVIHMMIMSAAMNQWRWYIEYMEHQYTSMKTKAQLADVMDGEERVSVFSDINFDDIQDIQVLQDQFLQTQHHLNTSLIIMKELVDSRISTKMSTGSKASSISSLMKEAQLQALRVTNILQRVDATMSLVRAILDFRSLASLQSSSRNMAELTRLGREDNELTMNLTQKAAEDADVLKTVTLLGLVYLPAAFVASMMSMNYITLQKDSRTLIHISGEFWIFIILTAIFLSVTLGSYYLWMRRYNRSTKARCVHGCQGLKQA